MADEWEHECEGLHGSYPEPTTTRGDSVWVDGVFLFASSAVSCQSTATTTYGVASHYTVLDDSAEPYEESELNFYVSVRIEGAHITALEDVRLLGNWDGCEGIMREHTSTVALRAWKCDVDFFVHSDISRGLGWDGRVRLANGGCVFGVLTSITSFWTYDDGRHPSTEQVSDAGAFAKGPCTFVPSA